MAIYYRTQREMCDEAEATAERERPASPVCFHCQIDLDLGTCVDAIGEQFCSTLCGVAVASYGHTEDCRAVGCADGAPLTLSVMLCGLCDQPTNGETAHDACRSKLRNAFAGETSAPGSVVA